MARQLKVFGWVLSDGRQAIIAATSQVEAARLAGYQRPSQMHSLAETANDQAEAVALPRPGVVFVTNSHARDRVFTELADGGR
jgi:hypothetical protein